MIEKLPDTGMPFGIDIANRRKINEIIDFLNEPLQKHCDNCNQISQLQVALEEIIIESGKVDKDNWPAQQQICQAIAQHTLGGKEPERTSFQKLNDKRRELGYIRPIDEKEPEQKAECQHRYIENRRQMNAQCTKCKKIISMEEFNRITGKIYDKNQKA